MPSQRYFDQCPPFPSANVPLADLPTISLGQLENRSQSEAVKLFDACCRDGFFMLDLRDSDWGHVLIHDAEHMFDLATKTMNLDKPVLKDYTYSPPQDLLGYKAAGNLQTDDGGMDTTDMYSLGQDDILGTVLPPRTNPPPIEAHRPVCRAFFHHAHAVLALILAALDPQLGLPPGTLLSRCALAHPSATSLRFLLNAPPPATDPRKVTFGAHADIGLITMLFHVAGGLQLLPPDSDDVIHGWRFVRPIPGHALLNVGDTLAAWTGGVLRSALHRVVTAPGEQNGVPRLSLAYLVRPARGGSMARLRGEGTVIPPLAEGEQDDIRTVDEWADERSARFGDGVVRR